MVRIAAVALLALSTLASAAPLARRQITRDQIVPLLETRSLSDLDVLPQLTARDLKEIIAQVKRQDCEAAVEAPAQEAEAPPAPAPAAGGGSAATDFQEIPYEQFQISEGTAGNCLAEVDQILTPFNGVDLATVSDEVEQAISNMRSAAEDAETEGFNPAIDAASGDQADQLQNGKIKNKCLKLRLFQFLIEMRIAKAEAAGEDTADLQTQLEDKDKKLANNIAIDAEHAGEVSLTFL